MSAPKPTEAKPSSSESAQAGAAKAQQAAPTHPAQLLETYRKQKEAAEKERDDFKLLLQRLQADFENYQKRAQRETAQERKYAHGPLALDFLSILDNFDRAMLAAKQAGESGPLAQGVAMIQNQLIDIFKRHGITRIDAEGKPFDPNIHQAVMQQPTSSQPPNSVLQALEQGFLIHDRVLRPARVVIATSQTESRTGSTEAEAPPQ